MNMRRWVRRKEITETEETLCLRTLLSADPTLLIYEDRGLYEMIFKISPILINTVLTVVMTRELGLWFKSLYFLNN